MQRFMHRGLLEAGVDEAGRGCLAGPVVAAAVVWDPALEAREVAAIRDSKRLSPLQRAKLAAFIEDHAIAVGVGFVDAGRIDDRNILQATYDAMHLALDALSMDVDVILVDGPCFRRRPGTRHVNVIDGDALYTSIAAASIVAKVRRDEYMRSAHEEYPAYAWDRNMGYGTQAHLHALHEHGPSPLHRRTFAPVARVLAFERG